MRFVGFGFTVLAVGGGCFRYSMCPQEKRRVLLVRFSTPARVVRPPGLDWPAAHAAVADLAAPPDGAAAVHGPEPPCGGPAATAAEGAIRKARLCAAAQHPLHNQKGVDLKHMSA